MIKGFQFHLQIFIDSKPEYYEFANKTKTIAILKFRKVGYDIIFPLPTFAYPQLLAAAIS